MGVAASKRACLLQQRLKPCGRGGSSHESVSRCHSVDQFRRWLYLQQGVDGDAAAAFAPSPRSGHTVCLVGDTVWLFGGCGRANDQDDRCLNDLYVYDLATLRWRRVQPSPDSEQPDVRRSASMCATGAGCFVLSGGAGDDPDHLRSDVYEFNTYTRRWTRLLSGEEAAPFRLCGQSVCFHEGKLVYFGGSTGLEYSNELYELDPEARTWRRLVSTGAVPPPRYKHQAFVHAGGMYVIGGGCFKPQCIDIDVYRLDLATLHWEVVVTGGSVPRARVAHSCVFHPEDACVYMWGGFTAELVCLRNFYRLSLATLDWAPIAPDRHELVPAARSFHGSVLHRGSVYLLSGSNGTEKFSDVWRYQIRDSPPPLLTLAARVIYSLGPVGSGTDLLAAGTGQPLAAPKGRVGCGGAGSQAAVASSTAAAAAAAAAVAVAAAAGSSGASPDAQPGQGIAAGDSGGAASLSAWPAPSFTVGSTENASAKPVSARGRCGLGRGRERGYGSKGSGRESRSGSGGMGLGGGCRGSSGKGAGAAAVGLHASSGPGASSSAASGVNGSQGRPALAVPEELVFALRNLNPLADSIL